MKEYFEKIENLVTNDKGGRYLTEQTMNSWDKEYLKNHANPYGGSMSRDEFLEVVGFLQESDTLKDMQLTGFEDKEKTGFRAFTLTDPKGDTNPVMVLRGKQQI